MDKHKIFFWIWLNLVVALLYSVAAYFGLFLAVPPGYATPIFASSGIALGFVLVWGLPVLPGVFIGSFIVNYYLTFQDFRGLLPFILGTGIGVGAMLQAAFGYFIVNKYIDLRNQLNHVREILLFALLSGPISCLVNTTWSNSLLYIFGLSPLVNIMHSWVTWWMGDSIGVLIFTPIILILFAKPKEWQHRFIPILLPLILSFTLVVLAHIFLHNIELNKIKNDFQYKLRENVSDISDEIIQTANATRTLSHYLSTLPSITQENFNLFSQKIMNDFKNIIFLGWMGSSNLRTISPVYLDERNTSIDKNTLDAVVSQLHFPPLVNRTEISLQTNKLFFATPVYRANQFDGLAIAAIDFDKLIQQKFFQNKIYYSFDIYDNNKLIYSFINTTVIPSTQKYSIIGQFQTTILTKNLVFKAIPSYTYINNHYLWHVSFILFGGLIFCVFIDIILFIIYGQKNIIQKKVDEQTLSIKEEQSKFLSLLNSVGEGIYGVDPNGNITFINQAANKMLDKNEILQLNNAINPLTQHREGLSETGTRVLTRKDGQGFWTEYTSTPLISQGKTVGAVVVFNDITKRREADLELQRLAHYDVLTELPNRASFLEILTKIVLEAKENHNLIAVCFIDIDNFKQVNDNYGHLIGDGLLKKVAMLIKEKLFPKDYIARLGGDEFGLIINHVNSQEELETFLNEVVTHVNQPIKIGNFEIAKSISIGVALYPYNSQLPDELLRFADIAMYNAKEEGKNNYKIYNILIHQRVQRKQQIDHYLYKAIENNEFSLLYQPQIQLSNNRLSGVEVLVHWQNDHLGGIIPPKEFIPIAEDNGLIIEIGEWIVENACRDFSLFLKECKLDHFVLSVNVSVKQLENDRYLNFVNKKIKEYKINPSSFSMEVTESALMKNLQKTKNIMDEIKESGIQFALDDFGTGYSSMEYLRSLPISVLKIDQSFIADIFKDQKDEIIIIATIQLANALGIRTIAEGVETKEQLSFIKAHGCDEAQGFYIAKPMHIQNLIQYGIDKAQDAKMGSLDF